MTQHVQCPAVVVHCMDFRFRGFLNRHFDERFPEGYDLVSLAGGIKSLIEDGQIDNFELRQLQLSDRLHHPSVIVLVQHEDCGAYGGSKGFQEADQELNFQGQELAKAKILLQEQLPNHKIETYFIRLSGEMVSLPG
ncbi:MAG: hypothetical protein Q7S62_02305 [bacterium]|nr:hypothetical protein [bacterium]